MTDILKTEETLSYALSSTLKGSKNAPFIFTASKVPILIRNDNLTS